MTPFAIFTSGLQSLSAWVMSILALVALLVFVIVCLALVELVFERGALSQAYTVKGNCCDEYSSSAHPVDEI
jgi:hypothetical protein